MRYDMACHENVKAGCKSQAEGKVEATSLYLSPYPYPSALMNPPYGMHLRLHKGNVGRTAFSVAHRHISSHAILLQRYEVVNGSNEQTSAVDPSPVADAEPSKGERRPLSGL